MFVPQHVVVYILDVRVDFQEVYYHLNTFEIKIVTRQESDRLPVFST